jgi:hypothetical protein
MKTEKREEVKEIKNQTSIEKMNETKNWYFVTINIILKILVKQRKKKQERCKFCIKKPY